jgi:hypothetical protein
MSSVNCCLKPHCPGTTTQNWCDDCMKDGDKSQNASYPFKAKPAELCPGCDSLKQNVEFKTYYHEGGDTIVCEDCFNEMQESEEEEDEEEEGQDCRGCGCWLPDGKECVFPGSWLAFCEPCFEERQEDEEEESE